MKMILIVFMLMTGLYAEEIGIPYVDFTKAPIESAVFSKDGKSFYTLQGQDLIHWNLSPLKKIKAWKLPLKPISEGKKVQRYHNINWIDENKRVLITSINELVLYNVQTNTLEKRVVCRNHSLVKDGDLLYLARVDQEGDKDEKGNLVVRPDLHLEVWNIPDLIKIKSINVTKQSDSFKPHLLRYRGEDDITDFHYAIRYSGQLVIAKDVIYYFAITKKVAVIDKKKLELKKILWEEVPAKKTADELLVMGTKIYKLSNASLISEFQRNDFKNVKKFLNESKRRPVLKLPQNELQRKISSVVGSLYLMYGKPYSPYIFFRKNKRPIARIGQYKDNLIIMDTNRNFEISSKEFELLRMKNKTGEIVPMNRLTFEKYNKSLQIKIN